jgi:hypothetical protein
MSIVKDAEGHWLAWEGDDKTIATPFDGLFPGEPPWAPVFGPSQMEKSKHAEGRGQRRFRPKGKR